jgi:ribosomal protein S1
MVEIGSVIEAAVEGVEVYGLFLKHGQEHVFVHLPDVSWTDTRDLRERFKPGDVLKVFVLRYNYRDRIVVGSLRRLCPEDNPYRALSRLPPGTLLEGRVTSLAGDEVTVEVANNAHGYLPKIHLHKQLTLGQRVRVAISGLEVDEGRLRLRLPEESARKPKKSGIRKKQHVSR